MKDDQDKGTSEIQRQCYEIVERLGPIQLLAADCLAKWTKRNGPTSSFRHFELFDPVVAHGKDGLRCIFTIMRGGKGSHLFRVISTILQNEGMPPIEIPEGEAGRMQKISQRYLRYADKHLPPSPVELFWSATLAQEYGDQQFMAVLAPPPDMRFGGTYFSGTLDQSMTYHQTAHDLRTRAAKMLLDQKGQW